MTPPEAMVPLRSGAVVEIVTIGDELLLGATVDSNAAWLGLRLAREGIRVIRRATVGDDREEIAAAVAGALERCGTVICTGGLGPTRDDVTRPAVAALLGRPLAVDPRVLADIRKRFEARGTSVPEPGTRQAEVPAGAVVLHNRRGMAPGLAFSTDEGGLVVLLPGPPRELQAVAEDHLPDLFRGRWPGSGPTPSLLIRTTGIAESVLAERLEPALENLAELAVAFLPSTLGVDLRVSARRDPTGAAVLLLAADLERLANPILEVARPWTYGFGDADLAAVAGTDLRRRGLRLALAESCTGGLLAMRITEHAGSSSFFDGGLITYADEAKVRLLGVPTELLRAHGAVSAETAVEMAVGARRVLKSDIGLAITGIAGPAGGSAEKPVGTVWYGLADSAGAEAHMVRFPGDRVEVRERASQAALALLRQFLETAPE